MVPEHDPQLWLEQNLAFPAVPTLLNAKAWRRLVKSIDAPPNNAMDLLAGRGTWIGTEWEPTPWGGMQRVRILDPDDGNPHYEPVRVTVLTPGDVRHGTCIPAGGETRRLIGLVLRSRLTGDLDLLRDTKPVDQHAELPGRRAQPAPSAAELELRRGARRLSQQRLKIRAVVGAFLGGILEQAVTVTADWSTTGWVTLGAVVAGAVTGAAAPFAAGRAGAQLSRPLTLAWIGDDPRSTILCILQYYLAHAAQLGTRGDALILEAWRLLYHTAGADPSSQAAMADVASRAAVLVDQAYAVAELLDAQAEVERTAARPKVEAIEQQEDDAALAGLRDAPDPSAIAELTDELHIDADARRTAARRLDNPA